MGGQDKFRWLSLVDYANKYKVSISTLRRKIKIEDIPFRLDSGKYYIVDEPLGIIEKSQGDQLALDKSSETFPDMPKALIPPIPEPSKTENVVRPVALESGSESVLVAANRLVDEIKKAYTLILQEKDEQIKQLRVEISDLKTLVRVLEGENERLVKAASKDEPLFFD